jgi:hypothetical protein
MAGLTQRKIATVATSIATTSDASKSSNGVNDSRTDLQYSSPHESDASLHKSSSNGNIPTAANSKGKTLAERSQIPYSFFVTFGTIISLEYFGGLYSYTTITSWYTSLYQSTIMVGQLLYYTGNVLLSPFQSKNDGVTTTATSQMDFIYVCALLLALLPLLYVFFIAPFNAGFWTGRKSKRHLFHRYMGLSYLIHYVLAWVEFFMFDTSKTSYLCHIIAVMGTFSLSNEAFYCTKCD